MVEKGGSGCSRVYKGGVISIGNELEVKSQAMIAFGEDLGMDLNTLQGAWETNINVRPEEDWKELKGRAVVADAFNEMF